MINDEVIKILKSWRDSRIEYWQSDSSPLYGEKELNRELEVFNKAIKALEQEPCEDVISRQAVLDNISRIGLRKCGTNEIEAVYECLRAVEALPPVTPKGITITDFADKCRECGREKVLDKIRAEIGGMYRVTFKGTPKDDWAVRWNDCLDEVLQIIDKYRTEIEPQESEE